jgi:hypothetical protein
MCIFPDENEDRLISPNHFQKFQIGTKCHSPNFKQMQIEPWRRNFENCLVEVGLACRPDWRVES